jgi:hypothetical protein
MQTQAEYMREFLAEHKSKARSSAVSHYQPQRPPARSSYPELPLARRHRVLAAGRPAAHGRKKRSL